jgi:hypothetical protein
MEAKDQLLDGMDVFDVNEAKVGHVVRYDTKLGYFETEGTFSGARYIPFYAIERIGPTGAYLNVTKSLVADVYHHMPSVTPNLTRNGRLTGDGRVASGYTGRPVPLDAEGLNMIRDQIHAGTDVFDANGKRLGMAQVYDRKTGYMRIEKEGISVKDIFLPVTSVAYLDERGIHLTETHDTIAHRFSRLPEIAAEFFAG